MTNLEPHDILHVQPSREGVEGLFTPPRIAWLILGLLVLVVIGGCQIQGASKRASREPVVVISRNNWTYEGPIRAKVLLMERVTRITVHDLSDEEVSLPPTQDIPEMLREIRRKDMETLNTGDIAYHYIIDRNGRIWEGRDEKAQGLHFASADAESGNLSLLVIGNFEEETPSEAQVSSLRRLLEALAPKHGIGSRFIFTHQELNRLYGLEETACPGKNLSPIVKEIRKGLPDEESYKDYGRPRFRYKRIK